MFVRTDNTEENNELIDDSEQKSVIDFFDLLISIDRRVNPHLYD